MLRTLLKVFGTLALIWLGSWLVGLIVFAIAPKAVNAAFPELIRFNYVGAPAAIIWIVLKVLSMLKASRAEPPISLAVANLPGHTPAAASGVLSPQVAASLSETRRAAPPPETRRSAPTPEPQRVYPSSSNPTAEPGVYTYSAPGMPMCPQCGERPAIFYCLTHRQAACLQCVAKHDEPAECFYVPAFRAPKSRAGS